MSDADTRKLQSPQQSGTSFLPKTLLVSGYGNYRVDLLTEDKVVAFFPQGRIYGHYEPNLDSQSEDVESKWTAITQLDIESIINSHFQTSWKIEEDDNWDKTETAVYKQSGNILSDSSGKIIHDPAVGTKTKWTSRHLACEILDPDAAHNMPRLREMILVAEETGFSPEASALLAPWLLDFALRQRDSNDPEDEAVVLSAIRTGASMLTPDNADQLLRLLESGHPIETCLVTLKMLGRIFEAQPPNDVDRYLSLAGEVRDIAISFLNPRVITMSQNAAMAQLAIYALVAMASSESKSVVEIVRQRKVTWFTMRTIRKLCDLREIWRSRPVQVSAGPCELLDGAIRTLTEE